MESRWVGGEFYIRLVVTAAVILAVFLAGGRTRWERMDGPAAGGREAAGISQAAAGTYSTRELIEQGIGSGDIDAETGLLYQVFALYGDVRLPERYRGGTREAPAVDLLCDAASQWPGLKPATQAALLPFLAPPASNSGWADTSDIAWLAVASNLAPVLCSTGEQRAQVAGQGGPANAPQ